MLFPAVTKCAVPIFIKNVLSSRTMGCMPLSLCDAPASYTNNLIHVWRSWLISAAWLDVFPASYLLGLTRLVKIWRRSLCCWTYWTLLLRAFQAPSLLSFPRRPVPVVSLYFRIDLQSRRVRAIWVGGRMKRKAAAVCSALWCTMGRSRIPYGNPWSWEVWLASRRNCLRFSDRAFRFFSFKKKILFRFKTHQMLLKQGSVRDPLSIHRFLGVLWILPILKAYRIKE